ncbi:DUF6221 family protein [Streptomyces globisporus]|uniref:DUF6221 family protein n=1 Tax=Streptomyces globisporus TaxID=1908 RepID=UPI003653C01F
MSQDIVTFLHARLDEEADLARRCDGDDCGEWTAHGHTVDFCQGELSGFPSTIALHVALHDCGLRRRGARSGLQINAIIIDAADPERLATFWSELLVRPIVDRSGPYV